MSAPSAARYRPARAPTLHFIGVSTSGSSIMQVFPAWARYLGLDDARIGGIDFPLQAEPAAYREAVEYIKHDPLSVGALITTHKLDLFDAAKALFDQIDPLAEMMGETSCLSKRDGRLVCHAKDPITSGLAIDGFLEPGHFADTGAELFSMGAGGSTIALSWYLMRPERGADRPSRIVVSDPVASRLDVIRRIHQGIGGDVPVEYVLADGTHANDAVLATLRPGSLVVNATGLGKDGPGSPLSDRATFPESAVVWELNYRGERLFLAQARSQAETGALAVHDGWSYFIHGWTQVIAEVFDIEIDASPDSVRQLTEIALEATGTASTGPIINPTAPVTTDPG